MHFNVTDLHCLERKIVKNKILASTTTLSFLGSKMIKISGLGTDFGVVLVEWGFIRTQI